MCRFKCRQHYFTFSFSLNSPAKLMRTEVPPSNIPRRHCAHKLEPLAFDGYCLPLCQSEERLTGSAINIDLSEEIRHRSDQWFVCLAEAGLTGRNKQVCPLKFPVLELLRSVQGPESGVTREMEKGCGGDVSRQEPKNICVR